MLEYVTYKLGDVATLINGRAYLMPELQTSGKYRIVRVGNFSGKDEWYYSDMELSADKYCENGDLLYKWACNFGPEIWTQEKAIYHYHIWKIIPDANVIDKDYLYYLLQFMTSKWLCATNGSTMVHITKETMERNAITVPKDVNVQKQIASVLKRIDSKITLNNAICAELEAMAKLLYDYRFVQFDFPDENGKPYKSSGGKMVWSEELKREIPEGWEVKTIGDISRMVTDSITPNKTSMYHHFSIPAFDDTHMPVYEPGASIDSNKYCVNDDYILVSKLNPQFKRIWVISKAPENSICSTEYMPFVSTNETKEYLYSTFNSDAFYTFMVNSSSSSTGSRKRMPPEMCPRFKIPYPKNGSVVAQYCNAVKPMLDRANSMYSENQELACLRDFLLPLLMNGQVVINSDE